jgi:hypothetical protein
MDLAEFRQTFLNTANARAAAYNTFPHFAFVEYAGEQLSEAGEISDLEVAFYRGIGSRNRATGIDAFAFDMADSSIRLVIADQVLDDDGLTITRVEVDPLLSRAKTFVEDALSGRSLAEIEPSLPAWSVANEIHRRRDDIARVRIYLVTSRVLNVRTADWPDGVVSAIPVESHIWDIARFHRLAQSVAGRDELEIDFSRWVDGGVPCLQATDGNGEYDAYLLAIPGALLADIYDEYGSRLLEGNVRSFLSTRPAVNKGIRNTAINEPWMFFAYNNGIATTASEIEVSLGPDGYRMHRAKDLQIVNGGQTTASLATARRVEKKSLAGVFVPMKLSVVSPERSEEMIPSIAKFANSQNRVNDADFFSNHEFHRRLEGFSRRLWAPAKQGTQLETHWFYERTRGQYLNDQANLSPAKRRQFISMNPREQVVTKTDLAKSEMAWAGSPHVVSLGAQKNFLKFAEVIAKAWLIDDLTFNEGYFREAMVRVMLFRELERLVSAQPWYQGGYRANVVAYTLAKLAQVIARSGSGRALDVDAIWRRQGWPDAVTRELEVIAKAMHEVIVSPPASVQNVTEWAKREQCWDNAKVVRVELSSAFLDQLVDQRALVAAAVKEKKQQRQDSGIEAQVTVLGFGNSYWVKLRDWANQRQLLLTGEDAALKRACGLASGFPDEWQAMRLLELKERMEGEGFPAPGLI